MRKHPLLVALLIPLVGCANLTVRKVTEEKRLSGKDKHVKGFRYYISRPYVVVQEPILVCEEARLFVVEPDRPLAPSPDMSALLKESRVSHVNPHSGAVEPVTVAELELLKSAIENKNTVRQTSHGNREAAPAPSTGPATVVDPSTFGELAGGAGVGGSANLDISRVADTQSVYGTARASDLEPPNASAEDVDTASGLKGKIKIVFLPDLDEQYAVHNCNFLSKSAYTLHFKDGWELTDVNGEFDSTAVPLEILNVIDRAIDAAKTVALAGVDRQARILGDAADAAERARELESGATVYRLVISTYLKPGVYRINKPWEIQEGPGVDGCGLLAKMGLATFQSTRIEPASEVSLAELNSACVK